MNEIIAMANEAGSVTLSLGWILGTLAAMAATISTLAGIIYSSLNRRIEAQNRHMSTQDELAKQQAGTIKGLQEDVKRLSSGCGLTGCHFHARQMT